MGFQQGLSGLNGASRNLDVIGNNIANSATVGFKSSRVEFSDIYATSLTGAVGLQIGIGTQVADITQQFTRGGVSVTNNPLDLSIAGNGFYRMEENGVVSYQRNGQFQLDRDGYIVSNGGQQLTGYTQLTIDPVTRQVLSASGLGPLQMSTADISPNPTTTSNLVANLDSTKSVPVTAVFTPADTTSYNDSTAFTVYDSLGGEHALGLYFAKTASNAWDVFATLDGTIFPAADTRVGALTFNTDGTLNTGSPIALSFPVAGGAATPQAVSLSFSGTSQFGSAFGVTALSQDGFASGRLAGFSVDDDGVINGRYSNGQTQALGQVALATFANPQGLTALGNNQWVETGDSGQALIGTPGTGTLGLLQSGAVEDSNVDLTQELVNLIVAQRAYQANAKTISAQSEVLTTLVNLR
jgi:flagellar hook protein FlgE